MNQVASTNVLSEPTIISKTAEFGVKNGHLELNCTVETAWSNRLEMKWELPNENIAKKVWIHANTLKVDRIEAARPMILC